MIRTPFRAAVHASCAAALLAIAAAPAARAQDQPIAVPRAESRDTWFADGQRAVRDARKLKPNVRKAKNVILFVGDGMGISTVTAARILEAQRRQTPASGEENQLSFETFPYVALSKTYQANQQTSDSAPTMTAMVTGVKTEEGVLSIDQSVVHNDHTSANAGNRLKTILEMCEEKGMSTGVVSTARITHATPAACYAHTPARDWESDKDVATFSPAAAAAGFPDIARQLVEFDVGDGLEVAFGGGRSKFLPSAAADPEDDGRTGERQDGRNLTTEWTDRFGEGSSFVFDRDGFDAIDPADATHVLGLFERSHMEYEADRAGDAGGEPSLTEMTEKAVRILQKNRKGFFLHVESGRIDHAHHAGNAYRALTDAIELANAVRKAAELTNPADTLIIVTADHSHVFTIAGYPTRGNPILGKVRGNLDGGVVNPNFDTDLLGLPYTTLGYQNGPGYTGASNAQAAGIKAFPHAPSSYTGIASGRPDLTAVDTKLPGFMQEAAVPLGSETHAGEDVAIYATGPSAHLFQGVVEQNVIFHVMADALRLKFGAGK
ncbi:MAG: hypothetical protein HMLKMBBP_03505 [Planctomycetes bacterium]|nr:hypothetical protein [Planctomycetota bacterium]